MICILVVSKDSTLQKRIGDAMSELRYRVVSAVSGKDAREKLLANHVDLVLADRDADACELCVSLRDEGNALPFIALIANPTPRDRRIIFRARADGYIEIPFDAEELQMRVKNLLWRCKVEAEAEVTYGECRLKTETYSLECGERVIELRRMEFLLLEKLLSYPGRIFTRNQLMDELWGYDCESGPRTVDSHIRQLRKKTKGVGGIHIQTIRGIGYRAAVLGKL